MRRSDKEIHDRSEIDDILLRASICHLGLNDRGECYVVPVNYGYDGRFLYIHSAPEGRKIDVLRADNRVSFTVCTDLIMKESDNACSFSMKYKSVMGRGLATLIDDHAAKEEALSVIMQHYAQGIFSFDPARVDKIVIIKIEIVSMSGKKSI
ncbi:MAG: pyridoxamine 5'-phosphate oxidase family protein [Dehalococcoidia bacterium]